MRITADIQGLPVIREDRPQTEIEDRLKTMHA